MTRTLLKESDTSYRYDGEDKHDSASIHWHADEWIVQHGAAGWSSAPTFREALELLNRHSCHAYALADA